ncbi:hypothetical protein EDD85DRAFT_274357 [Armillaria nabsnona]|nr:hypothetical protein EDD85DRAFT_274357 [Armillaria nabsnona]
MSFAPTLGIMPRTKSDRGIQSLSWSLGWVGVCGKARSVAIIVVHPLFPHCTSLGRTGSSLTDAETNHFRDAAEDKHRCNLGSHLFIGPHVGGAFVVIESNPEPDKEIWKIRLHCAVHLHRLPSLDQSFLHGSGIPLISPSSIKILSPITTAPMTSSPVEI